MEKNEGRGKVGCVRTLGAVLVALLCVPPMVWAYTEFKSGAHTVNSLIEGEVWVFSEASVTMEGEAHIADVPDGEDGNMYVMGIVHFHAGVVDGFIDVSTGAIITVYGTGFADSSGPISTTEWNPPAPDYSDTLTGTYENGTPISLLFNSNTPIILVDTGSGDPVDLILQLIADVELLNNNQGIVNSLDAKLDAALNALDDVNQNNDVAAINTLQAFINAVEAQRDNKISIEDADSLIADAQAIIDLLGT